MIIDFYLLGGGRGSAKHCFPPFFLICIYILLSFGGAGSQDSRTFLFGLSRLCFMLEVNIPI